MRRWKHPSLVAVVVVVSMLIGACGGKNNPAGPTNTTTTTIPPAVPVRLTPPVPDNPDPGEQLDTLKPTFRVANGTSDQAGTRTYEFQISDKSDFSLSPGPESPFFLTVSKTGVPEGSGTTTFTLDEDLQPTTRYHWRARLVQGSTASEWSATETFRTKLVGYLRAGELYDPLIHGETVGERIGSTTFVAGRGIRLDSLTSRVKYALSESLPQGEFSVQATGLDNASAGESTKLFSMQQGSADLTTNPYRATVEKRFDGTVSFRLIAGNPDARADADRRIVQFTASATYYWKFTWGNGVARLVISEGDENGRVLFSNTKSYEGTYRPNPQIAHLGAPVGRGGAVDASTPGAIIRNVWLSSRSRPSELGSALSP